MSAYGHDSTLFIVKEMIANGFGKDLLPSEDCPDADSLTHKDLNETNFGLLKIVREKLESPRHKAMGSPLNRAYMLGLVIYSGCDATWDLSKTQRNGNYRKWRWLDRAIWEGIIGLSKRESFDCKVYCGLRGVGIAADQITQGYFNTYLSTSRDKAVAKRFLQFLGILVTFDENIKGTALGKHAGSTAAADISWISKFEREKEILFLRGMGLQWAMKKGRKHRHFSEFSLSLAQRRVYYLIYRTFCKLAAEIQDFSDDELKACVKGWVEMKPEISSEESFYESLRADKGLAEDCKVEKLISALKRRALDIGGVIMFE